MNPTEEIGKALGTAFEKNGWLGDNVADFDITHPKDDRHGDYTSNVALILGKKMEVNPREVAEKIVTHIQNDIQKDSSIDFAKTEIAGPGFINFYLKESWLVGQLKDETIETYGTNNRLMGKKVMVEYTDPNPFKEMHIGHLMSNTIGESIARLNAAAGAHVKRACYQGDVGLHVAKSIWGIERKLKSEGLQLREIATWDLNSRQRFLGHAYAMGATAYEDDETAKVEMHELNKKIYQQSDSAINALYQSGRSWSLEYFETIYARLGTKFDEYFFESEAGRVGLKVVDEALAKGILEVGDEGAVVYKGEKDGMHTRVFRNKLGLPTYEAKDLGLAKTKYQRYLYDMSYIVTANEITEYFKVVLRVMEQLYPDLRAKTTHIPHGIMKLTTGKMSSRTGKVVTGESLLNELKNVVLAKMGDRNIADKDTVADQVAVGALKYTVLKQQVGGDIVYDPDKITNLDGDTGPYLQYAYARTQAVIKKSENSDNQRAQSVGKIGESEDRINAEESQLLRWLYRYPEVVEEAGRKFAPNLVAQYLYELAGRYNLFYTKHKIVGGDNEHLRITLTAATGNVLKLGLGLLGIIAPHEM